MFRLPRECNHAQVEQHFEEHRQGRPHDGVQ